MSTRDIKELNSRGTKLNREDMFSEYGKSLYDKLHGVKESTEKKRSRKPKYSAGKRRKVVPLFPKEEKEEALEKNPLVEKVFQEKEESDEVPLEEICEDFFEDDDNNNNNNNNKIQENRILDKGMIRSKKHLTGNPYKEVIRYNQSNIVNGETSTPILEEEKTCIAATVALSGGLSVLIEGKSRSGKSLILDKLIPLLTPTYVSKNCSNKAFYSNAEEINKHDYLYITEYQSSVEGNPVVKEILKLLTENKDAVNESNGRRSVLNGDICVLSTGADENIRTQKRDVEVSGRFILLRTRSDSDKIERICEYQDGLSDGTIEDKNYTYDKLSNLKKHIEETIKNKENKHENPFAKAFAEYLPNTQKSIYYRTLFNSMIKAFTNFDRDNKVKNSQGKLIVGISDIYITYQAYYETYCNSLKKLTSHSYKALEKSLDDNEKEEARKLFEIENEMINVCLSKEVDWQEMWNFGYKHMEERNPELLDKWVKMQSKDGKVTVYNPFTDTEVNLCKVK